MTKKRLMILTLTILVLLLISIDAIATNDTNGTYINSSASANHTNGTNYTNNASDTNNTDNNENNTGNANVNISVSTEYLGYDKAGSVDKIRITITTDRLGTIKYTENYYMKTVSGKPKFYVNQEHYKENLTNTTISFNISRPTRTGDAYPYVKAVIVFDNKVILKKKVDPYTSREARSEKGNTKDTPGFKSILSIIVVLSIYFIRKIR